MARDFSPKKTSAAAAQFNHELDAAFSAKAADTVTSDVLTESGAEVGRVEESAVRHTSSANFAAQPEQPQKGRPRQILVRNVSEEIHRALRDMSYDNNVSLEKLCNQALVEFVEKYCH